MDDAPFDLAGIEPISRLGGGGFGDVWLARQVNIDRQVAIKIGHAPIDDKTVQLRFERECVALGRLSGHPNIIDVFTAGQLDDGRPYLVLEFVNGGTLWQRLQRGPLSEPELIRVGIQLCDALSVAHAAGVLHRDLKPENVLLRQNGEAVLGDFGIARLHDGANTTSHAITASVAYAAPEILSGKPASVASDLYGIGICLLACVLQSVPFVQKTDESIHPIINRVLSDRPPNLRQHGLSNGLADTIGRLLEKNPDKRPPSAEAAKQLLERAGSPPPPAPPANAGDGTGVTRAATGFAGAAAATGPGSNETRLAAPVPPSSWAPPANPTPAQDPYRSSQDLAAFPAPTGPPSASTTGSHRPPSGPGGPAGPPSFRPDPEASGSDRIRLFGAVFGATLLLGGLLVFAVTQLTGDDDGDTTTTDDSVVTTTEAETTTTTVAETTTSTTEAPTTTAVGPLALPLTLADMNLGDDALVEDDPTGPDTPQFCDNTPLSRGATEWIGETSTAAAGFPAVYQGMVRFETEAQAAAYLASYVATVNCSEWTLPADDGVTEIIVRPEVVDAPARLGDDNREIAFQGEAGVVTIVARAALVRGGTEVYLLSVTSILETDLSELDRLLGLAVDRLGY